MAEAAGLEPARGLVNNQVPYQLGYASIRLSDCGCRIADWSFDLHRPQSEIRNPQFLVGRVGVEPTTSRLKVENSS